MNNNEQSIFNKLENAILNAQDIPEKDKQEIFQNIGRLKNNRLNILITGATGCGKSSTINALFNMDIAKVGVGVNPETMDIEKYELGNMVLWDSPGLGDGKEADNRHAKNIIKKLNELDEKNHPLIDLVLVILDGSSRDMGTSYQLINEIIIPNLGKEVSSRLLIAINQADMAMKGRGWDMEANKPQPVLQNFLDEKADSVKRRIKEATGVDVEPIYYSAGFTEDGIQQAPYNLSKLMYLIVQATPSDKRVIYVDTANKDPEVWKSSDEQKRYTEETKKTVERSLMKSLGSAAAGAYTGYKIGSTIGSFLGPVGRAAGGVIGAIGGAIAGFFGW
jgi:hypothetical protein